MIAKLCSWGHDRNAAIGRMQTALDAFTMRGIGHNIPFLSAVMEHDRFISGNITTAFIDEEYREGFRGVTASPARKRHLGMAMPRWRLRAGDAVTPRNPSRYSSSIKAVVMFPLIKRSCSITADRNGILCPIPRMVKASSAVCMRPMAALRSCPQLHNLAIIGS